MDGRPKTELNGRKTDLNGTNTYVQSREVVEGIGEKPLSPKSLKSAPPTESHPAGKPLDVVSTYRSEYVELPIAWDIPRDTVAVEPSQPFKGESSYKSEYTKKDLPTPSEVVQVAKPAQTFFGETSYRNQYPAKPLPKAPSKQKSTSDIGECARAEPMESVSTYRGTYTEMPIVKDPPQHSIVKDPPQHSSVVSASQSFEGESTYRAQYTKKDLPKHKETIQTSRPAQPFYGETSYRNHYSPKILPKTLRKKHSAPACGRHFSIQVWQEPLEGESTYKREFIEKPLAQDPAPKKLVVTEKPRPFEGKSSYRSEFTEKRVTIPTPVEPPLKPSQVFHGKTSYSEQYCEKPLPQKKSRPKSAHVDDRPCPDLFDGMSTYKQEYVAKELPRKAPSPNGL